jgi:hypothetical protein
MLTTTLLLLWAFTDAPRISSVVVEPTYDLALLSHRTAGQLDGRRVRFRVDLESEPGDAGSAIVYDCASLDGVNRTVWLVPGQRVQWQPIKDAVEVEGVLRVLWRPPGNGFEGYWEYRIEAAVRKRAVK